MKKKPIFMAKIVLPLPPRIQTQQIPEVTTLLLTSSRGSAVATMTRNPSSTPILFTYSPVSTSPKSQAPVKYSSMTQALIMTQPSSMATTTIPSSLSRNNEYSMFPSITATTPSSIFAAVLPN